MSKSKHLFLLLSNIKKLPYIKHYLVMLIPYYYFIHRKSLASPPLPAPNFVRQCWSTPYQIHPKLIAYALNLYGLLLDPSPDSISSVELK